MSRAGSQSSWGPRSVPKQLSWWQMQLWSHPDSCVAWGISVLVPWLGLGWLGFHANKLEWGLWIGACQYQCPHDSMSFWKWLLPVSLFPGWAPFAFCLSESQQLHLTQAPFKLLLIPWVLEQVRFCVCHLRVQSVFYMSLAPLKVSLIWPPKLNIINSLVHNPQSGVPAVGLGPIASWGEIL